MTTCIRFLNHIVQGWLLIKNVYFRNCIDWIQFCSPWIELIYRNFTEVANVYMPCSLSVAIVFSFFQYVCNFLHIVFLGIWDSLWLLFCGLQNNWVHAVQTPGNLIVPPLSTCVHSMRIKDDLGINEIQSLQKSIGVILFWRSAVCVWLLINSSEGVSGLSNIKSSLLLYTYKTCSDNVSILENSSIVLIKFLFHWNSLFICNFNIVTQQTKFFGH